MKLFIIILLAILLLRSEVRAENTVHIYAASSLTDAITELVAKFEQQTLIRTVTVLAASSVLARQIQNGAPADIFVSANQAWMNELEVQGLLLQGTRFNLLKNVLVLVTQRTNIFSFSWKNIGKLKFQLRNSWLALGNPDHVPAGIYAKTAFENLGVWNDIYPRIIAARNVRMALTYVINGEALLGVVYKSDIVGHEKVKMVSEFPIKSHPQILYPAAALKNRTKYITSAFLAFLKSNSSRVTFRKYGFMIPKN